MSDINEFRDAVRENNPQNEGIGAWIWLLIALPVLGTGSAVIYKSVKSPQYAQMAKVSEYLTDSNRKTENSSKKITENKQFQKIMNVKPGDPYSIATDNVQLYSATMAKISSCKKLQDPQKFHALRQSYDRVNAKIHTSSQDMLTQKAISSVERLDKHAKKITDGNILQKAVGISNIRKNAGNHIISMANSMSAISAYNKYDDMSSSDCTNLSIAISTGKLKLKKLN